MKLGHYLDFGILPMRNESVWMDRPGHQGRY
jgi:hypothetical protein